MPADISQYTVQMVELSWRRVLAIAQNQADEGDPSGDMPEDRDRHASSGGSPTPNAFYDRERRMIHALDSLFSLACDGQGYVAFISTIVGTLNPESPVAMAFLSHILDRAALPSKQTMAQVTSTILAKLEAVRRRHANRSRSQADTTNSGDISRSGGSNGGVFGFLHKFSLDVPRKSFQSMRSTSLGRKSVQSTSASDVAQIKINACVIWSLLAEKFAGDMCSTLWSSEVCDVLLSMLADKKEDIMVRVFALLALEKLSLTAGVKETVLEHPRNIQAILLDIIQECEAAPATLQEESAAEEPFWSTPPSPLLTIQSTKNRWIKVTDRVHNMLLTIFSRRKKTPSWLPRSKKSSRLDLWSDQNTTKVEIVPAAEPSRTHSTSSSATSVDSDGIKKRSLPVEFSSLNIFDTGYLPPEGTIRDTLTKYVQLAHCARWSYDNIFSDGKQITNSWSMASLNVVMNPFDATPHWKVGSSGLELRNDCPHFESIRATACVKSGKWYYETLLLSDGIMQIGWATSRCRFVPEDGYGVGDDCNGFAFDTYRSAVWADGSAVYPQSRSRIRCHSGDVLGSFLDLDNGLCSFFINGRDMGLTVEFEHPARQMHALNLQRIAKEREAAAAAAATATATTSTATATTPATPSNLDTACRDTTAAEDTCTDPEDPNATPSTSVVGLGLYPAVSLTTHQHILLNFGDRPWMYPPPITAKYKGVSEASKLNKGFTRRISHALEKRWGTIMARQVYRPASPGRDETSLSSVDFQSDASDYDWDGPLCTICFSEPKNTILMPCRHGGLGKECAKALDMCPLCRASIHDRITQPVTPLSS